MPQDVDQRIALLWFVEGSPVGDALDTVLLKNLDRMVAEPRQQVRQFSRRSVVDPQFVNCR